MTGKKITIKLTDDQQKQIHSATGKSIKELNIDVATFGQLTENDLEIAAGGTIHHEGL